MKSSYKRIVTKRGKTFPDEPGLPLPKHELIEKEMSREADALLALIVRSGVNGLPVREYLRKTIFRIYNMGYDNGLKHMDQMHTKIDELIKNDADGKD